MVSRTGFFLLAFHVVALAQPQVLPQGVRNILTDSTYLGGSSDDYPGAVAVDAQGNVYIAGNTVSPDFPVTPGAFQTKHGGIPGTDCSFETGCPRSDAFVTKLDPSGKMVYSTYLGGSSSDAATAIAVDAQGNAYIAGTTSSPNFPVTPGAFQTSAASNSTHGFVAKLNPAGSALVYSTLLGGSGYEQVHAIRLDSAGNVYVIGTTTSMDFPVTSGSLQTTAAKGANTNSQGFVVKLNPAGASLVYGTYLNGSAGAAPAAMALTAAGEVLVAGTTVSPDFPTTAGAYETKFAASPRRFVAHLNAAGSALVYSTFLGGDDSATVSGIDIDSTSAAYVTGSTGGAEFPATSGPIPSPAVPNVFVAKLSPAGNSVVYATLLGGDASSTSSGIAVDLQGNAFVTGTTFASNFPLSTNAYQTGYGASVCLLTNPVPFGGVVEKLNCGDAFLTELDPTGLTVLYSTYFGSNWPDNGVALAVGPGGSVSVVGVTESAILPATASAVQTHRSPGPDCTFEGSPSAYGSNPCHDAFVARFDPSSPAPVLPFEIVNGASYLPGAVAPGELVALFGPAIGPAQSEEYMLLANGSVSTVLGGIRVLFDGTPAPLLHVGPNQINAVVPHNTAAKAAVQVEIETNGVAGPTQSVEIATETPGFGAVVPGIFSAAASGAGQAAVFNQDGTVNGPAHPAPAGSVVGLYATGLGTTNVTVPDGQITDPSLLPTIASKVEVFVGGQSADVLYAGAAPYSIAGITQVNFRVPAGSGTVPVFLSAGHTVASQSGVWITVQ